MIIVEEFGHLMSVMKSTLEIGKVVQDLDEQDSG